MTRLRDGEADTDVGCTKKWWYRGFVGSLGERTLKIQDSWLLIKVKVSQSRSSSSSKLPVYFSLRDIFMCSFYIGA